MGSTKMIFQQYSPVFSPIIYFLQEAQLMLTNPRDGSVSLRSK